MLLVLSNFWAGALFSYLNFFFLKFFSEVNAAGVLYPAIAPVTFCSSKSDSHIQSSIGLLQLLHVFSSSSWKYLDISDNRGSDRDIQIFFGSAKTKPLIKIRHDPYSDALGANLSVKCEIEGKNSRLGSLVSFGTATNSLSATGFTDLWARVDSAYAKKVAASFERGSQEYKKGIDELNKEYAKKVGEPNLRGIPLKTKLKKIPSSETLIRKIIKLNGGYNYEKKIGLTDVRQIMSLKPSLYESYQNERIYLSVTNIISSFEGLIRKYFNEGRKVKDVTKLNVTAKDMNLQIKKNNVILEIYKYASGMSPSSGKYVIAKWTSHNT